MEKEKKKIAKQIKSIREGLRLSQQEFAEQVGISTGRLSIIERGLGLPSITTLEKIAKVVKIKTADMIDF